MKPLSESREWPMLAVYDIEAENWTDVTLVGHVDEYGNRRTFKTISSYLNWLFGPHFEGNHVWAHWGGHYDHRFVIHHATIRGWNWETVQSGNTIIIVTVRHPNGKEIKFCESARLMPDSVKRIGKTVGLAKLEVDRSKIENLSQDELIEYCLRDCDIVMLGLQYLKKALTEVGADFAYTLASIASRWVRKTDILQWHWFFEGNDMNQGYSKEMLLSDEFCQPAYFGGRVEVFKRGLFRKPLYYYDIRSSYPWSMLQPLPTYFAGFKPPLKRLDKSLERNGISEATVTVPRNVAIPVLCAKHDGKLLFPTGTMRGRWTNIELARALEQGAKVELHAQAVFKPLPFLRPFVETFYKLRQKAISEKDDFRSYAYKILLNSLYGKLIETVERQKTIYGAKNVQRAIRMFSSESPHEQNSGSMKPTAVPGVYTITTIKDGAFRHVAAGAYITARSRLRLLDGMDLARSLGGEVYYCDTDSIVTDINISDHPLMHDELGCFKQEHIMSEAEFISPKVYRYIDAKTGEQVYRVKGTPVKVDSDEDSLKRWNDYISGEPVSRDGIGGFASDLKRGSVAPRRSVLSRALKHGDTKRIHTGEISIPIHFEDT